MKVCVVGLGYIGLPTALMLAAHGIEVDAVDYNEEVVTNLQAGKVTFKEDGLDKLLSDAKNAKICFRTDYPVDDFYIVAVPTPYIEETKKVDASYVVKAVEQVLDVCSENTIIVIESTISPGTIDRDIRPLTAKTAKKINLVHAPERIIPGNMIYELCQGEIVVTDIKTAEMSKVVENTFRDINIAYANELAKICRQNDMDVYEVIKIANKHPRVNILQPGPGVGGHCISVDPWFLVGDFPETAQLIRQAREVNSGMPEFVLQRIQEIMDEKNISDLARVGLYGLTYKEDVDDVRESPTLQLLDVIKRKNLPDPAVFDPMVTHNLVERQYMDFESFLSDIDMVVVLVGHSHLKNDISKLNGKAVLDTRNIVLQAYKL